jgi:hypothetical protein
VGNDFLLLPVGEGNNMTVGSVKGPAENGIGRIKVISAPPEAQGRLDD